MKAKIRRIAAAALALLALEACEEEGRVPMETAEYEITRWSTGKIDTVALTAPMGFPMAAASRRGGAPEARCWDLRGMDACSRRFYVRGRAVRSMKDVSEIRKLRAIARYPGLPEDSLRRRAEMEDSALFSPGAR